MGKVDRVIVVFGCPCEAQAGVVLPVTIVCRWGSALRRMRGLYRSMVEDTRISKVVMVLVFVTAFRLSGEEVRNILAVSVPANRVFRGLFD